MKSGEDKSRSAIIYLSPDISFAIIFLLVSILILPMLILFAPTIWQMGGKWIGLFVALVLLPAIILIYQYFRREQEDTSRSRLILSLEGKQISFLPGTGMPYEARRIPWNGSPLFIFLNETDFRFDGDHGAVTEGLLRVQNDSNKWQDVELPGLRYALPAISKACSEFGIPAPVVDRNYRSLYGREEHCKYNLQGK